MKVVSKLNDNLNKQSYSSLEFKQEVIDNVIHFTTFENVLVKKEMRLIFFSKGDIYLESCEAKFAIRNTEGLSISDLDCFGQLITGNFNRLITETTYFRFVGSPVSFTLNFYNKDNTNLATLISDSIFKNIGFGKGEGEWLIPEDSI